MLQARWMWTDARGALFGRSVAKSNPLRWSSWVSGQKVAQDLEKVQESQRPIVLQLQQHGKAIKELHYANPRLALQALCPHRPKNSDWIWVSQEIGKLGHGVWVYVPDLREHDRQDCQGIGKHIKKHELVDAAKREFDVIFSKHKLDGPTVVEGDADNTAIGSDLHGHSAAEKLSKHEFAESVLGKLEIIVGEHHTDRTRVSASNATFAAAEMCEARQESFPSTQWFNMSGEYGEEISGVGATLAMLLASGGPQCFSIADESVTDFAAEVLAQQTSGSWLGASSLEG